MKLRVEQAARGHGRRADLESQAGKQKKGLLLGQEQHLPRLPHHRRGLSWASLKPPKLLRKPLFPFESSQPGDIFYTTSVDGQPLSEESIEVPPGFDQATDGLTVPWAAVSNEGLVISEPATGTALRCLVGPREADKEDRDWLQFRSLEGAARHEVKGYEKG